MHQIILDYLSTVLTWPVLACVTAFVLIWRFRREIAVLIPKLKSVKVGPAGLETYQEPSPMSDEEADDEAFDESLHKLTAAITKLDGVVRAEAESNLESLRKECEFWEFMYLSYHLVPITKTTLTLVHNQRVYDLVQLKLWLSSLAVIVDQQNTILNVLIHHDLLKQTNQHISITDKGTRFLKAAGLIPA